MGGTVFGRFIGSRVDREISAWASSLGQLKCNEKDNKPFHAYTQRLIQKFKEWGWKPVQGQYCVGTLSTGVGTAIDLLMRDREGRLVAVELKCGFDGYFQTPVAMMKPPFQKIPCCPLNRARMQLLFGYALLLLSSNLRPASLYVINVNKSEIDAYKVEGSSVGHLSKALLQLAYTVTNQRRRAQKH